MWKFIFHGTIFTRNPWTSWNQVLDQKHQPLRAAQWSAWCCSFWPPSRDPRVSLKTDWEHQLKRCRVPESQCKCRTSSPCLHWWGPGPETEMEGKEQGGKNVSKIGAGRTGSKNLRRQSLVWDDFLCENVGSSQARKYHVARWLWTCGSWSWNLSPDPRAPCLGYESPQRNCGTKKWDVPPIYGLFSRGKWWWSNRFRGDPYFPTHLPTGPINQISIAQLSPYRSTDIDIEIQWNPWLFWVSYFHGDMVFSIFFPICILVQLCPITRWLSWLSRFWRVPDFPTPWSCCHIALPSSGPRQWARPISQGPDGSVEGFTCASTNKDVASCGGCKTAFPTWFSWSMLI